ncbi:MAG: Lytic transglycosylase catalytic [Actinomycetospora sp.]|nr:Lytic transglycosylase catalytic [Actinomycetospora sp.]
MGRHGRDGHGPRTSPVDLGAPRAHRDTRRTTSRIRGGSGSVLVAAVAAGAVLPAVQTLGTHVADAEAPRAAAPEPATAALALASRHRTAGAVASVSPVTLPASTARTASSSSDDGPSAGDDTDVSALLKSMEVTRENGPLEFGRPYEAGNERTLDGQIARALGLMGLPQRLAPGVKKIIMRESTGDPDAVNNWDSNAAAGTPSKGLMQLIDTTYRNAVLPELADRGIFDPVANITAGVRTMIANHSIDDVAAGGLRNSSGDYIGYGGAAIPDDGLGLAD